MRLLSAGVVSGVLHVSLILGALFWWRETDDIKRDPVVFRSVDFDVSSAEEVDLPEAKRAESAAWPAPPRAPATGPAGLVSALKPTEERRSLIDALGSSGGHRFSAPAALSGGEARPLMFRAKSPRSASKLRIGSGRSAAVGHVKRRGSRRSHSSHAAAPPADCEDGAPKGGGLTAGEWRDLDNWPYWRRLSSDRRWDRTQRLWSFDLERRLPVRLRSGGKPVADAEVTLRSSDGSTLLWTARTDNQGRAELFAEPFTRSARREERYRVHVAGRLAKTDVSLEQLASAKPLVVDVVATQPPTRVLDLMFVVDTTGSMADELRYLQTEVQSVVSRVSKAQRSRLDIRVSVNFYRDHGDEYVVLPFPFTSAKQAAEQLTRQHATGGGDTPEAVDEALADAVSKHDWSRSARARLLFLLLDAPPHVNPSAIAAVHRATAEAASKGIRIIPVTGSGIDKRTEFLMRFMAIATGGTYVFLTNDSGIGRAHIESHKAGPRQTIGETRIQALTDLLVRLITTRV